MIYAVVVPLAVAVLYALVTIRPFVVFEHQRGLRYRKGRLQGVVDAGRHWIYTPQVTIQTLDVRPRFVSILGQEVLSSDGVTIRVSLAAEFRVEDPVRAVSVESYEESLYLSLQLELRALIGGTEIEGVLQRRSEFGRALLERVGPTAGEIGLELMRVDVKDVMFPGDLKKMFAQVVGARKEGQAALEKARGESAALRNLSNAARLVERSPGLFQLRLLQQLAGSSGNMVVVGFPPGATPLPVREGDQPLPEGEPQGDGED